ncbi:hypothetical protein JCM15765_00630 [Paradesulfitobacterium aromaticivorans]
MSKFDYMNFSDGSRSTEFVTNAKIFTKEQTIELCVSENDWRFEPEYCDGNLLRKPNIEDVVQRYVRWYVKVPEWCGYDDNNGGGCYTFCKEGERGSFPVWVIEFEELRS